jgi:outer membrane protein TolC
VNVDWPLFDGGKAKADVAEASASKRAAEARLAEFDSQLALEIRQRLSEGTSGRAAVTAADGAIRSATEARRVVGERFAAGVATSTDVLDAQIVLLQAELERTRALTVVRVAEAGLARAVGQ